MTGLTLADTIVLMDEGGVAASGPIEKLMRSRSDRQRLTGTEDLGTVLSTTVEGHAEGLTRLRFEGGVMWGPPRGRAHWKPCEGAHRGPQRSRRPT